MTDTFTDNPEWSHLKRYIFRMLLAFDQWFNAVCFFGFVDETVSGRVGRAVLGGNPKWWVIYLHRFIDAFFLAFFGDKDHCIRSIEPEDRFDERPEIWRWSK